MPSYLDLTDAEFQHIASAFSAFHLGPGRPPWFRDFLVRRLRSRMPDLADRVASASDEQVERLFVELRADQLVG